METRTITVRVDADTADSYEASSETERRRIDLLINLRFKEVAKSVCPLTELMAEISHNAQKWGLTPEILESILAEE